MAFGLKFFEYASKAAITALLGLGAGCSDGVEPNERLVRQQQLGITYTPSSVTKLPNLEQAQLGVIGRDDGYSVHFRGVSAWVWGDTFTSVTPVTRPFPSSTWSWTTDTNASDGIAFSGANQPRDANGAPQQFLPYDQPNEQLENTYNVFHECTRDQANNCTGCLAMQQGQSPDEADCGDRVALWPGPAIKYVDERNEERALVFYDKLFVTRDGKMNMVGTSIARWDDPKQQPRRTVGMIFPRTSSDEASRRCDDPAQDKKPAFVQPLPNHGAVTETREGVTYVYAYACTADYFSCTDLTSPCLVARAPFATTGDRVAPLLARENWRFYIHDGIGFSWTDTSQWAPQAWTEQVWRNSAVVRGGSSNSVQYNRYLNAYTAVYSMVDNAVYLRTAARPEGPWSEATKLFVSEAPSPNPDGMLFNYFGLAHPEFDRGVSGSPAGKLMYITVSQPSAALFRFETLLYRVVLPGGLSAEYFNGTELAGAPLLSRVDSTVGFRWGSNSFAPQQPVDHFSVRWRGQVVPRYSQTYTFSTLTDDGVRLTVNGRRIIDNWTDHGPTEDRGTISLVADVPASIVLEYYEKGGDATAVLSWQSPSQAKQEIPTERLAPAGLPR